MPTTDASPVFLDTNVLVYAEVREAPLYRASRERIQELYAAGCDLWVSRQIFREFVAILTRPQAFSKAQPASKIAARLHDFETIFHVADETAAVTAQLIRLTQKVPIGGRQIHDANIVATMLVYGVRRILTHNVRDFNRFQDVITVLPLIGL